MKALFLLAALLGLTACGDIQYAAYHINGGNHSLSLTREQAYAGSEWDTALVVARYPDCQRRYPLKGVVSDRIKMDVYRTGPGVFILNAGKRWYVTETATCRFEQYKEAPPEPGELMGVFQIKDGQLQFVDKAPKAPAAGAAKAAAPQ
jgi:hypothetical protein